VRRIFNYIFNAQENIQAREQKREQKRKQKKKKKKLCRYLYFEIKKDNIMLKLCIKFLF